MDFEKIEVKKELNIIFMGTPDFAVPVLKELIENYNVRAIVTQPDRVINSHKTIVPPIKEVATSNHILCLQPNKIKDSVEEIKALEPDLIITCAYGQILPKELLDSASIAAINVHASLLPKLRGGAPIHRAIIEGHSKTGITIMHMDVSMDTGDIISQEETEITKEETASSLHDKLSIMGAKLLVKTLPSIIDGSAPRIEQDDSKASYAFVIKRKDEKIDFKKNERQIRNQVRGLNSWPGAYCRLSSKILKVWNVIESDRNFSKAFEGEITGLYKEGIGVKVSNGEVIFTEIQPEGKGKMKASDYLNGLKNKEELIGKILD